MSYIEKIQASAQAESAVSKINGWLFTGFGEQDIITEELLGIAKGTISSRRWVYIVPANSLSPIKITHTTEPYILSHLPAKSEYTYTSRDELFSFLKNWSGQKFAILCDSDIPLLSTVDGGFIELLHRAGISTVSAAPIVQRCKGLLSSAGMQSHERASTLLYKIVASTWNFIVDHHRMGIPLTEGDTAAFIMKQFIAYNLTSDHAPIVAFGKNTTIPHYEVPPSGGAVAKDGDTIQLDIWAKERMAPDDNGAYTAEAAIYADISWVGVYSATATQEQEEVFSIICKARDAVRASLEQTLQTKRVVTGAELDRTARNVIKSAGYANGIKHRTGHGIDTRCHGSGVNLDDMEFPDSRAILSGSCFSVEPGIYTNEFGMRTEMNIYIAESGLPIVSGRKFNTTGKKTRPSIPQNKILTTGVTFDEDTI